MRMVKKLGAKGAALAEYVVLMAIVGGLAIFAIMDLGADVQQVYGEMDNTVATEIQEASGLPVGGGGAGNVPGGAVNVSVSRTISLFCKMGGQWWFGDLVPPDNRDWVEASWVVVPVSGDLGEVHMQIYSDGIEHRASEETPGWGPYDVWDPCEVAPLPSPFVFSVLGQHPDGSTVQMTLHFVPSPD